MFVFSSDFESYAARSFTSCCGYTAKICKGRHYIENSSLAGLDAEQQSSDPEFGLETFPHVRCPSRITFATSSVILQFQAFIKV